MVEGAEKNPRRKAKPKLTEKEQSERFIETARKLGVEETGEAFERLFEKLVPPSRLLKNSLVPAP